MKQNIVHMRQIVTSPSWVYTRSHHSIESSLSSYHCGIHRLAHLFFLWHLAHPTTTSQLTDADFIPVKFNDSQTPLQSSSEYSFCKWFLGFHWGKQNIFITSWSPFFLYFSHPTSQLSEIAIHFWTDIKDMALKFSSLRRLSVLKPYNSRACLVQL